MPRRGETVERFDGLRWVADEVERARDDGTEIVYRCDREPHPATRRLMQSLGVRIEVVMIQYGAQELGASRDCTTPNCLDAAERGLDKCSRHATDEDRARAREKLAERETLEGAAAVGDLAVSGAAGPSLGEPERAASPPNASQRTTLEHVLSTFRRFHAEHGRWPLRMDRDKKLVDYLPGDHGLKTATGKTKGSWQAVWDVLGAGPVPTGKGARNYRLGSSGGGQEEPAAASAEAKPKPKAKAKPPAEPPAVAPPPDDAVPDPAAVGTPPGTLPATIEELTGGSINEWRGKLLEEAAKCEMRASAYRLIEEGLSVLESADLPWSP